MKLRINTLALLAAAMTSTLATAAQGGIDYEAGVTVNAGSSHLAPYYIASNRGGTLTQQYGMLAFASAVHELDTARRVSWGFGAEAWAGYSSSADYDRYSVAGDLFYNNSQHPARLWVQQLYIEGKLRTRKYTARDNTERSVTEIYLDQMELLGGKHEQPQQGTNPPFYNQQRYQQSPTNWGGDDNVPY